VACAGTGATRAVTRLTPPESLHIAERTRGRAGRPGHRAAGASTGTTPGNRVPPGPLPGSGGQGGIPAALASCHLCPGRRQRAACLAPAGVIAFYNVNGRRPTLTNDDIHDPVVAAADETPDAVDQIAAQLARATKP